jgi:hypothetical protein
MQKIYIRRGDLVRWKKIFQSASTVELIFYEPIKAHEIEQIEEAYLIKLSGSLLEVLQESNGVAEKQHGYWLIGNANELIEMHCSHHDFLKQTNTVPPHEILFFANNGCGEYFGFRLERGQIADGKVGVYYPIENEFTIVAPDFKAWVVGWCSGALST